MKMFTHIPYNRNIIFIFSSIIGFFFVVLFFFSYGAFEYIYIDICALQVFEIKIN